MKRLDEVDETSIDEKNSVPSDTTKAKANKTYTIFDLGTVWTESSPPRMYGIRIQKDEKRHCRTQVVNSCSCPRPDTNTFKFCGHCGQKYTSKTIKVLREDSEFSKNQFKILDEGETLFIFHPDDQVRFMYHLTSGTMTEKANYFAKMAARETELGSLLLHCGETIKMDMDGLYKFNNSEKLVQTSPTDGFMDVSQSRYPSD